MIIRVEVLDGDRKLWEAHEMDCGQYLGSRWRFARNFLWRIVRLFEKYREKEGDL